MRTSLALLAALTLAFISCGDDGGNVNDNGNNVNDNGNGNDNGNNNGNTNAPDAGLTPTFTDLVLTEVATGLDKPLYVTQAPGDNTRLFILEQEGDIRVVENGTLLPTPFLSIAVLGTAFHNEAGLLGLAFHPDYQTNGKFYVNYNKDDGNPGGNDHLTVIAEYTVSGDPNVANAAEKLILEIPQFAKNHNGGMIEFGSDGYLYIGMGDGGGGGDPQETAQDNTELLGAMLRIDVDGGDPYAIPADNPLVGDGGGVEEEIYAWGLRNPWRWSFDMQTGDMYIADVGQSTKEEVNAVPAASTAGRNYGWDCREGTVGYAPNDADCPNMSEFTEPIAEYNRDVSVSITGGYVYRGTAMPDLAGYYFFGDAYTNFFKVLKWDGAGGVTDERDITSILAPGGFNTITSFGQDNAGEIYVVERSGKVDRIERNSQ
jgi:glucose/arabinose dehydrogenase